TENQKLTLTKLIRLSFKGSVLPSTLQVEFKTIVIVSV
ncbi:MAG: hypothetical protein ACI9YO_002476, partial [Gammaproteobacteria bacterium]